MQESLSSAPTLMVRGKPVRPWLVLTAVAFGLFMSLLDMTIVNIAIPAIQTNLKTNLTNVSWILDAYNLVFAVLLVTVGRLADQYGRKLILTICMSIFTVGSLLCGLSQAIATMTGASGIDLLIGFRGLQAVGAAGLSPISLAITMAVFPAEKRGRAISVWAAISGLAAAIGPVLGGVLVENLDWRYIFFVNIPLCIIGLVMITLFVPALRTTGTDKHIDITGIFLLTLGIFCLVFAIIQGNTWGWSSTAILLLFALAAIALILLVIVELRQKDPILDFHFFRLASFTGANIVTLLFGIVTQGIVLMLTLYYINARGFDEIHAAYAIVPVPIATFIASVIISRVSHKLNPYIMGIVGMVFLTVCFFLLFTLKTNTSYIDVAWRSILYGIGMGIILQSQSIIALSEVPSDKYGVGSGIFNTFRQIGFTLGVAILISIFSAHLKPNLQQAANTSIQQVQANTVLPAQMKTGIDSSLQQSVNNTSVSAAGSSGTGTQNINLTKLANQLPPQTPAPVKTAITNALQHLTTTIKNAFLNQLVNTFKMTWLVSALLSAVGIIPAVILFLLYPTPPQKRKMNKIVTKPMPK
jgi:EmrB/QacA subfamily drug resistance transporter